MRELSCVHWSPEGTKISLLRDFATAITGHTNIDLNWHSPSCRRKIFKLFSNNLSCFLKQLYSDIIHNLSIKTYNSVFFSIFAGWSKHHLDLILQCFCHPLKETQYLFKKKLSRGVSEAH